MAVRLTKAQLKTLRDLSGGSRATAALAHDQFISAVTANALIKRGLAQRVGDGETGPWLVAITLAGCAALAEVDGKPTAAGRRMSDEHFLALGKMVGQVPQRHTYEEARRARESEARLASLLREVDACIRQGEIPNAANGWWRRAELAMKHAEGR